MSRKTEGKYLKKLRKRCGRTLNSMPIGPGRLTNIEINNARATKEEIRKIALSLDLYHELVQTDVDFINRYAQGHCLNYLYTAWVLP